MGNSLMSSKYPGFSLSQRDSVAVSELPMGVSWINIAVVLPTHI